MRGWIGTVNEQEGRAFEERTATEIASFGHNVRGAVQMTELGASRALGDIDVLAACRKTRTLLVVECKRLRIARTIGEIGEQLKRFRSEVTGYFERHKKRCDFVTAHLVAVSKALGTDVSGFQLRGILVTDATVPLQYMRDLPLEPDNIIPFRLLNQALR
jgi:hypothetical protein